MGDNLLLPDEEYGLAVARSQSPEHRLKPKQAILACGALAHEIMHLIRLNSLDNLQLFCLPAKLHLQPEKIVPRLRERVAELRAQGYESIYIGYGDCGTAGLIDKFIVEEKLERIAGEHCYEFFAGSAQFLELVEQELCSFYLTDYLARFFETLIIKGFKIDTHPELLEAYFGNYKKLVYLAQTENASLDRLAEQAAKKLGLEYQRIQVGYGLLADFVKQANSNRDDGGNGKNLKS